MNLFLTFFLIIKKINITYNIFFLIYKFTNEKSLYNSEYSDYLIDNLHCV